MRSHTQDQAGKNTECKYHDPIDISIPEDGIVTYFSDYWPIVILDVDFVSHGMRSEIYNTIASDFAIVKYSLVCAHRGSCDKLNQIRIDWNKA
jgi:hypothetical protein